ncbi:FAD-dependent monooxygenase [Streptomyces sp. NPDC020192]|uniref:FAD-dependent monooxygenase n=1 Tax=Streptomyces sp. NPDC020192 TaxID=3365066 RepID=UPI003789B4E0
MTDVVIAGGGPVGLMLACELRLAGVDVLVLERLTERVPHSKALGMHARTLEVLDQRGIAERFLEGHKRAPTTHFAGLRPLEFDASATRHPYMLLIPQAHTERLLAERAAELGVEIRYGTEVTGLAQDADGVDIEVAGGAPLRARYLVGCDGSRSTVRLLLGVDFPGTPATLTATIADVSLDEPPATPALLARHPGGQAGVLEYQPGMYRAMTIEYDTVADPDVPVTFDEFRATFRRIAGTDHGMRDAIWVSRFGDAARQADRYRVGRVFLAGDAAHIHNPSGGQGLNLGVQDAVNLGWKLAAAVRGQTGEDLLDSYHTERHPVGARVLQNTHAQVALSRPGHAVDALRELFAELIRVEEVNRRLTGLVSALDVRYPIAGAHPLTGARMPDADLKTSDGDTRVSRLLHSGRGVLLDLTEDPALRTAAAGWADRVDLVPARHADARLDGVDAVLVRPDGYVAWAAPTDVELPHALTTWFGPAR